MTNNIQLSHKILSINKILSQARTITLLKTHEKLCLTIQIYILSISVHIQKGGVHFAVFPPPPHQIFLFFAGEQFNMCTLSWLTTARAEAGLFSSYTVLKVGGVIQYDPDE